MANAVHYELPEMSEDFAWWLGVQYADGYVEKHRGTDSCLSLACTEDEPEITYKYMDMWQIVRQALDFAKQWNKNYETK